MTNNVYTIDYEKNMAITTLWLECTVTIIWLDFEQTLIRLWLDYDWGIILLQLHHGLTLTSLWLVYDWIHTWYRLDWHQGNPWQDNNSCITRHWMGHDNALQMTMLNKTKVNLRLEYDE